MTINRILFLDAATCAVTGLLLVTLASTLATLLALPPVLLRAAGLTLVPIALLMALLSRHEVPPVSGVWLVIAINGAWILASFVVIAVADPNFFGVAFLLAQAAVIAALTWAEWSLGIPEDVREH